MRPDDRQAAPSRMAFTAETLNFVRGIARNNDREWFQARRATYERALRRPMLDTVALVNEAMLTYAPEHVKDPERTVLRIYRDTRFSANKQPYKQQHAAWWGRAGMLKTSGAGFYFHLSAKHLHIAAGLFMPDAEQTLLVRRYLLDHHSDFRRLLQAASLRERMRETDSNSLARAPKGFPAEHPAIDLARRRNWGVEAEFSAERALGADFPAFLTEHFRAAAPLVHFLNRPLPKASPSKGPLLPRPRALIDGTHL